MPKATLWIKQEGRTFSAYNKPACHFDCDLEFHQVVRSKAEFVKAYGEEYDLVFVDAQR